MHRHMRAAGAAAAGYVVGVILGGILVYGLSSNSHDRKIEAPMTGLFVTGPLLFVAAGAWGPFTRRG